MREINDARDEAIAQVRQSGFLKKGFKVQRFKGMIIPVLYARI